MSNRKKLIQQLIGNLSNAILHEILEKAINNELAEKYNKEIKNSFEIAKIYREKINPKEQILPLTDREEIKNQLIKKVKTELIARINKGYKNINLELIEIIVEEYIEKLII